MSYISHLSVWDSLMDQVPWIYYMSTKQISFSFQTHYWSVWPLIWTHWVFSSPCVWRSSECPWWVWETSPQPPGTALLQTAHRIGSGNLWPVFALHPSQLLACGRGLACFQLKPQLVPPSWNTMSNFFKIVPTILKSNLSLYPMDKKSKVSPGRYYIYDHGHVYV